MSRFDPRHPFYLMIKPPRPVASIISDFSPTPRRLDLALLHATMIGLGKAMDRARFDTVVRVLDSLPEASFRVVFDQFVASPQMLLLKASEPIRGFLRFQAAVRDALVRAGVFMPRQIIQPHISIDYRWMGSTGTDPIIPISWQVEDFMLIESVSGQRRHIIRGRWRLTNIRRP